MRNWQLYFAVMIITLLGACHERVGSVAESPRPFSAEAADLRIYPLGDSITRGLDDEGYRGPLYQLLTARKISFHFVGSLSGGPAWLREPHHDGHDGWTIGQLTQNIDVWLRRFQPDIILLMIGSNDIEQNVDVGQMPQRLQTLLQHIVKGAPNARVLVSEVSLIRDPDFDQEAQAFNLKVKSIVTAMAARGLRVTFVPMHDVLSLDEIDEIDHPNATGNRQMAARWMEFLNLGLVR